MARKTIDINGRRQTVDAPEDMPLLWVLRDLLGLTGTKYGCGVGVCGSCTVLENGVAIRSCQTEFGTTAGKSYTTIEGLSADGNHPIQRAWLAEDVAQCGYCQPGMMLELRSLLGRKANPSGAEIDSALSDHVCRCGSYPRIRKAALLATRKGGGR
jgi:aerobic-type carbon monoxide dehydrogenase small subunit (CoxS/CutS family)